MKKILPEGESVENTRVQREQVEDILHEECGVFGMYDFSGNDVASTIYY